MVLVSLLSCPLERLEELTNRYPNAPALPDDMTMRGPYGYFTKNGGYNSIQIYEFDQTKIGDAIRAVYARLSTYNSISGLTYDLRICSDPSDAAAAAEDN